MNELLFKGNAMVETNLISWGSIPRPYGAFKVTHSVILGRGPATDLLVDPSRALSRGSSFFLRSAMELGR